METWRGVAALLGGLLIGIPTFTLVGHVFRNSDGAGYPIAGAAVGVGLALMKIAGSPSR